MKFDWHRDPINRATKIDETYKNTQSVRRFLTSECGETFRFDRSFMAWIKSGIPKNMGEVADEWIRLRKVLLVERPSHTTSTMDSSIMTATRRAYLIEQLAEMPRFLTEVFLAMPREQLARAPEEDNLSLIEHLWHINDCESDVYYPRIVQALDHDKPALLPMPDIGSWPLARAYAQRDGDDAIREFVTLRQELVERLQDLEPNQFERVSIRQNGTTFDVYDLLEHLADHDRDHRRRMAVLLRRGVLA